MRIGDGTLDWDTLHRLSTSGDPDERPIVQLEMLEPMASLRPNEKVAASPDAKAFFALVDKALAASASRDLLVCVHGSNNTLTPLRRRPRNCATSLGGAWWCGPFCGPPAGRS